MTTTDRILSWLIHIEGGLVNDPNDPGGLTKYGISKFAHPDVDIQALTEEEARSIYAKEYVSEYAELPWPVSLLCVDAFVQHGYMASVIMLQHAVNEVSPGCGLAVDGKLGPKTIGAVNGAEMYGDPDNFNSLVLALLSTRIEHYVNNVKGWNRYGRGWMSRVAKLMAEAAR